MCLFAFLVLLCASVMSYKHSRPHNTVIPKQEFSIFFINCCSALLAFALVLKPTYWKGQFLLVFVQAVCTTLTGYCALGTFLYAAFVIIGLINGFFKTKSHLKIGIILLIWLFVLVGYGYYAVQFGTRGVMYIFISLATSLFFFGFYFYVYKKLESLLIPLVPAKVRRPNTNMPPIGTELYLSDYGLSERQIKLVLSYLTSLKSYEQLASEFLISTSTVKKDMIEVFEKFNVKNIKELHILLIQYFVKE